MTDKPAFDWRPMLAAAMVLLLGASVAALFLVNVPDKNRDLIIAIVSGIFGASVKDIYGFYFGSSKGSSDKDAALIANSATPPPPAGSTTTTVAATVTEPA